jgi:hypothetical protein
MRFVHVGSQPEEVQQQPTPASAAAAMATRVLLLRCSQVHVRPAQDALRGG